MRRASCQFVIITRRLIGFGALLCFPALITASGPHLVHHLVDQHPGHHHLHTNKSQCTDCLVLSLMLYTPLVISFASYPAEDRTWSASS
jgi:hypothetical protein